MSKLVRTETGALYEVENIAGGHRVKRSAGEHGHSLRRDGQWVEVFSGQKPRIGQRMIVPADYPVGGALSPFRESSPIVSIEEK